MRFLLSIITIISGISFAFAQTDIDALRYSTPMSLGTARSASIGNAITGIGGDISTINSNPAGLAQVGISEFTFSGGFNVTNSKNKYLGTNTPDQQTAFQLNNFGVVYVPKKRFKNIKNISIAASYNSLASFNYKVSAKSKNDKSSYSDIYAEQLNADKADSTSAMTNYPFGSSLAFESGIIGKTEDNLFYSILELPINQRFEIKKSGNMSDFSFGSGIAFNDKIMLGLSIGIPFISYDETFYVRETDEVGVTDSLSYWDKEDKYRTEGTGFNAKIGVLVHPIPNLRLGVSFTTPTRYSMKDQYSTKFRADYETYTLENFNNPAEGYFDYKMVTPLKFNGGVAFIHPKFGFVSIEYEMTNPSKTKYLFAENMYDLIDFESSLNESISNKYKAVHTIKAGIEGKVAEFYRVRAGFQYRTSAYKNQAEIDQFAKNTMMTFSGGFGYRGKNFYLDAAYVHMLSDEFIVPYNVKLAPSEVLTSKFSRSNIILTAGFKF